MLYQGQRKSLPLTVSTDMALEQSLNKDTKTKGGIIGFTQNENAVEKWTLTAHLRAAVHKNFQDICGGSQMKQEKELAKKTITDSEIAVINVLNTIKEHMNPFAFSSTFHTSLQNIVSGSIVKDEHRSDILNAKSIGNESAQQFIQERIIERTKSFWDPIKKLKFNTFTSENKPFKSKE